MKGKKGQKTNIFHSVAWVKLNGLQWNCFTVTYYKKKGGFDFDNKIV